MSSASAAASNISQKSSSRDKDVGCPANRTERFRSLTLNERGTSDMRRA